MPKPSKTENADTDSNVRIHRNKRTKNFSIVDNDIFKDPYFRETPKAGFILLYILSKPDDWDVRVKTVASDFDLKRQDQQRVFRIMRESGYAKLERIHKQNGDFLASRYAFSDTPDLNVRREFAPIKQREAKNSPVAKSVDSVNQREAKKAIFAKIAPKLRTDRYIPRTDAYPCSSPEIASLTPAANFSDKTSSVTAQHSQAGVSDLLSKKDIGAGESHAKAKRVDIASAAFLMLPFDEKEQADIARELSRKADKPAKAKGVKKSAALKTSTAAVSTKGRTADQFREYYQKLVADAKFKPYVPNVAAIRSEWSKLDPVQRDAAWEYAKTAIAIAKDNEAQTTVLAPNSYLKSLSWTADPAADLAEWITVAKGSPEATMLAAAGHDLAFAPDRHTGARTALVEAHKLEACRAASEV